MFCPWVSLFVSDSLVQSCWISLCFLFYKFPGDGFLVDAYWMLAIDDIPFLHDFGPSCSEERDEVINHFRALGGIFQILFSQASSQCPILPQAILAVFLLFE